VDGASLVSGLPMPVATPSGRPQGSGVDVPGLSTRVPEEPCHAIQDRDVAIVDTAKLVVIGCLGLLIVSTRVDLREASLVDSMEIETG
jgi:hypothetical protein